MLLLVTWVVVGLTTHSYAGNASTPTPFAGVVISRCNEANGAPLCLSDEDIRHIRDILEEDNVPTSNGTPESR